MASILPSMLKIFNNIRGIEIFNDNGRFETYHNVWPVLTKSIHNFLFGISFGYDNYNKMGPHNFILEWFLASGIIGTVLLMLLFLWLLLYCKRSRYIGLIFDVFISCMFITSFFSNTFTTVVFIIIMIDSHKADNVQRKIKQAYNLEC